MLTFVPTSAFVTRIEMTGVTRYPRNLNPAQYAIEMGRCYGGSVRQHRMIQGRYSVAVSKGSSNLVIENIRGGISLPAGKIVDIHGGDCKGIIFRDVVNGNSGIIIGNGAWRRGADDVSVENCVSDGVGVETAIRNVTFNDNRAAVFILSNAANRVNTANPPAPAHYQILHEDDGNGFMNSTGEGDGHPVSVSLESSAFLAFLASHQAPIRFSNTAAPFVVNAFMGECRFRNVVFRDSVFEQAATSDIEAQGVRFYRRGELSDLASALWVNCLLVATKDTPNFVLNTTAGTLNPPAFPFTSGIDLGFELCDFSHPASDFSQIILGVGGQVFKFRDCTLTRKGTTETITMALLDGPPLMYSSVPSSGTLTISA